MAEKAATPESFAAFEYELFEGDPHNLRTAVATSNQSIPWIDPATLKLKYRIGRGSFGDVYLATCHQWENDYQRFHKVIVNMLHSVKDDHVRTVLDRFDDVFSKCQGAENVGLLYGVSVIRRRLERVTHGLATGDWVRLKDEAMDKNRVKNHSPVGILHSIDRDGRVSVGLVGTVTLWRGSSSGLQMAEAYCSGQFVRPMPGLLSLRYKWPCKRDGDWATGRIMRVHPSQWVPPYKDFWTAYFRGCPGMIKNTETSRTSTGLRPRGKEAVADTQIQQKPVMAAPPVNSPWQLLGSKRISLIFRFIHFYGFLPLMILLMRLHEVAHFPAKELILVIPLRFDSIRFKDLSNPNFVERKSSYMI
ncbi:hypothetical protein SAY87_029782 [Trapa incisa]|uniref:Protein kinase domain-containing protein n=1 Tax=Trapa incisa TaxID=236973 RepID=A0AAN7Q9H3_9MYRT|nr:hypothetical protein SAY87_029782 [Trapa incisa]